jgi:hypothetical protein
MRDVAKSGKITSTRVELTKFNMGAKRSSTAVVGIKGSGNAG